MSVELKLNSKNEAHIKDRHNHGNDDRCEDRHHREVQDDRGRSSEEAGGESMTREDHEEAHFFAFVAHNLKAKKIKLDVKDVLVHLVMGYQD